MHTLLPSTQRVTNVEFQVGDIHALDFSDNTFDIVHAHQVLQHVADPIQALREMRRVVKPGGIVAARETADASIYPELPSLEASWTLAATMVRLKGENPHPGKKLGCYSSPEEREFCGETMDMLSGFGPKAVENESDWPGESEKLCRGVEGLDQNEDGWISLFQGEILCRKE
jgi:SAM-dependent methyltransferase